MTTQTAKKSIAQHVNEICLLEQMGDVFPTFDYISDMDAIIRACLEQRMQDDFKKEINQSVFSHSAMTFRELNEACFNTRGWFNESFCDTGYAGRDSKMMRYHAQVSTPPSYSWEQLGLCSVFDKKGLLSAANGVVASDGLGTLSVTDKHAFIRDIILIGEICRDFVSYPAVPKAAFRSNAEAAALTA